MRRAALMGAALIVSTAMARADVRLVIPGTNRIVEVVCDSTLGAAVIAPVPGSNAIGPDHAAAIIVETQDAEPEIVSGITEFSSGGLGVRLPVSDGGQILTALTADQPIRFSRENVGYIVPAQESGAAVASLTRSCRKDEPPRTAPLPPGSYWSHNRSIMRLEAEKSTRRFVFYTVSEAMAGIGAKPGAVRFEGRLASGAYAGKAILYTEKCGTFWYQVTGRIENNDERVVLTGQAPKLDSTCKETGKRGMTLSFDFIKPKH